MSLAPLNPIQMLPARDRVAAALREAILSHQFAEGEELTLKDTAAQLGVSSTPIREAFQMLSREGLIELRPNRGAIVLGMNEKRLRDHYETRAALERAAVVLVCRKRPTSGLSSWPMYRPHPRWRRMTVKGTAHRTRRSTWRSGPPQTTTP